VVDREERRVVNTFTAPAFYCFHQVNAFDWEDISDSPGLGVSIDLIAYDDIEVLYSFSMERIRAAAEAPVPAELRRYRLPLGDGAGGSLSHEVLWRAGGSFELPQINRAMAFQPDYRFVYLVSLGPQSPQEAKWWDHLVKVDIRTGDEVWWHEEGCFPGEPIFVGRPQVDGKICCLETDGVVLSVVLGMDGTSFLLVLDAVSFTEIGRALVPGHVPFGFHGDFQGIHSRL